MLKKIILCFLVANFFLLSTFTAPAKAQTTWYSQTFFDWYIKVYDPVNEDEIFGERYTAAQVEWVIYSTFAWVINHVGIRELNWCVLNLMRDGFSGNLLSFFGSLSTTCPGAIGPLTTLFKWAGYDVTFGADLSPMPYASTIPADNLAQAPPSNFNLFPKSSCAN